MPKGDAPAFLFDVDAWLTSVKVAVMNAEQERGYLRLLLYQWKDPNCRLPDNDSILAALSKMGEGWFNGGSALVRACFRKDGEFLMNDRLLEEKKRWESWRNKSSEGGKRSGEVRRKKALTKGGSTKREPKGKYKNKNYNIKEEKIPSKDGAKRPNLWDVGVAILVDAGDTEVKARTFLGSLTRDYGKTAMAEAVAKMSAAGPIAEPHGYLKALLRGSKLGGQVANELSAENKALWESRHGANRTNTPSD